MPCVYLPGPAPAVTVANKYKHQVCAQKKGVAVCPLPFTTSNVQPHCYLCYMKKKFNFE